MGGDRWATFDCYGTLIDWNAGIRRELARVFGEERADEQLERYHEIEPALQADGSRAYRDVMTAAMRELGASGDEAGSLGESLPGWEPFPEVREALTEARARGWKLAILSNTDRDFIEASVRQIGLEFELCVVASEIGSWKPSPWHWEVFLARSGADRDAHVHVAQSLFHDVAPCISLGIPVVWINRLGEDPHPQPTRELHDLHGLPGTLDDLVAA